MNTKVEFFIFLIHIFILHAYINASQIRIIDGTDIERIQYDNTDIYTINDDYHETCMKSIYNSVEFSIQYLDTNYYFIVLYFDRWSDVKTKYINGLKDYQYIPVECGKYIYGVWIFSHGNFVIYSGYSNSDFLHSLNENTCVTHSVDNITFSFYYEKSRTGVALPDVYQRLPRFGFRKLNMSLDKGTCVQSLYNEYQYIENADCDDEYCINKSVLVLNLDQTDAYSRYSYKNNLNNYYYKSVECNGTIFGVWISSCGQFTIQSTNIKYTKKSCTINKNDVVNYIMDFNGGLVYTLNQNTKTYIDNNSSIIINFDNKYCANSDTNDGYDKHSYCQ